MNNKLLILDHIFSKVISRLSLNTRYQLNFNHGFGLYDGARQAEYLNKPLEAFVENLIEEKLIIGSIDIIKINPSRNRVVFAAKGSDGNKIIIKWHNDRSPCTFNYIGSMATETRVHDIVANEINTLIPKLIFKCDQAIATDFINGKDLQYFLITNSQNKYVGEVVESLLDGLAAVYLTTQNDSFSVKEFNEAIMRDFNYMRQVSDSLGVLNILSFINLKADLSNLYKKGVNKAGSIFENRPTPWVKCLCLRDLDPVNILYQKDQKLAWVIDTEDAMESSFIFDLVWLSSRVYYNSNAKFMFSTLHGKITNFISKIDLIDPRSSIALYNAMLSCHLSLALANPMILNSSMPRKNMQDDILSIIETLQSGSHD